jgi:hypothetical protein
MKLVKIIHTLDNYREVAATDPKEKVLKRIRIWRNSELSASDWTQVLDAVCDKVAWAKYRQELRDLPASNSNVTLIEKPLSPDEAKVI